MTNFYQRRLSTDGNQNSIKPASFWNRQLKMLEEKVTYRKKLIDADFEAEKEEI